MKGIREALDKIEILSFLSPEQKDQLVSCISLEGYRFGQVVFEEGDAGDKFYLIHSGKVRVVKDAKGTEVSLATLGPGAYFGEIALIKDSPRTATIRAAVDTTLLSIDRRDFEQVLREAPTLAEYFKRSIEDVTFRNFFRTAAGFGTTIGEREVEIILRELQSGTCTPGEEVERRQPGLRILKRGELAIVREQHGDQYFLGRVKPGDTFGEDTLEGDEPVDVQLIARGEAEWYLLGPPAMQSLTETSKTFGTYIAERARRWQRLGELDLTGAEVFRGVEEGEELGPEDITDEEPHLGPAGMAERLSIVPRGRAIRKFPLILQLQPADCGAACLGMVLHHLGLPADMGRVRAVAGARAHGQSLEPLASAAEKLGLHTRVLTCTYDTLEALDLPVICHWEGQHYVVLYRVDSRHAWAADPARGLVKYRRESFERHWNRRVMLVDRALAEEATTVGPWRRFFRYVLPHKGLLVQIGLTALCLQLLALALPKFTEVIVDKVVVHKDTSLLSILVVGMLIVNCTTLLLGAVRTYIVAHVGRKVSFAMMRNFYDHLLRLPVGFFHGRKTGDILKRFRDNTTIRDLIMGQSIGVALDAILVVVYIAMMLSYTGVLTLAALGFIVPFALLALIQAPVLKQFNRKLFDATAEQQSVMVESVHGMETVKTLDMQEDYYGRWEERFCRALNVSHRLAMFRLAFSIGTSLLNYGSTLLLLYFGARLVIDGRLSVGQLMAFNVLVGAVFRPIMNFVNLYTVIQEASVSLERLCEVLETPAEEVPGEAGKVELTEMEGYIKFEKVWFRYGDEDSAWVLQDLSFEVPAGQTCAVVGRSGCGKTTLIRLLLRLYTPTEGRILIDGIDISQISVTSLRTYVAAIMQESFLFNTTLRENITMSDDFDRDELEQAADMAAATEFIDRFPLGYETNVGERGSGLSGGQRQRVAIARALYRHPAILLMDEATSALDTASERAIQRNLDRFLGGRTAVVIAHRMSTIRDADQILVLDGGRIAERGNHETLMAQEGLYYHLCNQ
jgi:ATP-binding cassette subfamily B protein